VQPGLTGGAGSVAWGMVILIRSASRHDEAFLVDMLYEALFVPPGCERFPRSVLDAPAIAHYAAGFGTRTGDVGFVAEAESGPVGAAWVRLLQGEDRGYGYIDDDTPELTVAVRRPRRGQGIGTALCSRLVEVVPRMSLSSDVRNPAISLYQRLGFKTVSGDGNSVTMLRRG
jgi:GNAT superfamily N-acetyltransferase